MKHEEDRIQETFFSWIETCRYGDLPLRNFCFAIPNGGNRNVREAARFKKQGVLAGVADVFLAIPKHGKCGLWIEFKFGDNRLSDEQSLFRRSMLSVNYEHVICYSFEDGQEETVLYLTAGDKPIARIEELDSRPKYKAVCRRMAKRFVTRRGAINWLKRRGFDENGERI